MESAENTHASLQRETLPEAKLTPDPIHKQSRFARWFKVLAVVLIVICVAGGVFTYTHLHQSPPVRYTGWCDPTGYTHSTPSATAAHLVTISPTDIWAFSEDTQWTNSLSFVPRIEHWDGKQWSYVYGPDVNPLLTTLQSQFTDPTVNEIIWSSPAVIATNDMWIVGAVSVAPNLNKLNLGVSRAVIAHWNGSFWQLVENPATVNTSDARHSNLNDVAAISATDIWAVGYDGSSALVERWNGSQWSFVQLPSSLHIAHLDKVVATSDHDIWAIGQTSNQTLVAIHWDGQYWNSMPLPSTLASDDLSSIQEISPNDIWVIETDLGASQSILDHWNGQHWSSITDIKSAKNVNILNSIAAYNTNDVWLVGSTIISKTKGHEPLIGPLIEHWNGQHWNSVALPGVRYGIVASVSIMDGKVWIMGDQTDASGAVAGDEVFVKAQC